MAYTKQSSQRRHGDDTGETIEQGRSPQDLGKGNMAKRMKLDDGDKSETTWQQHTSSSSPENMLELFSKEENGGAIEPGAPANMYSLESCPGANVGPRLNRYDGDHYEVAYAGAHNENCTFIQPSTSTTDSVAGDSADRPSGGHHYDRCTFIQPALPLHGMPEQQSTSNTDAPLPSLFHQGTAKGIRAKSDMFRRACKRKTQGVFVETTPFNQVKTEIEKGNSVLIIGGSGDGKSSILQYLSAQPTQDYLPIQCTRAKEALKYLELVQGTNLKLLLVYDDPFGGSYRRQDLVEEWICMTEQIEMYLDEGDHKIVFASRSTVWKDCKMHLESLNLFGNVVEVTSNKLTIEDKRKMLESHLKAKSDRITGEQFHDITSDAKPLAFGQCCRLMREAAEKDLSGEAITGIFQRPFSYLHSQLQKMADQEKTKYATLCLVMLCGGRIQCTDLSGTISEATPGVREKISVVLEVCGCKDQTCGDLQQSAEKLLGTYLEKQEEPGAGTDSREVYTFAHDSIHEAVTMEYGKHHFRHCLKFLHHRLIVKVARPRKYNKLEHEFAINVPAEYNRGLAEVFTAMASNGNLDLYDVFQSPCVAEESLQCAWVAYLTSSPESLPTFSQSKYRAAPTTEFKHLWCVLYYVARSGSCRLLKFLMDDHSVTCGCRDDSWFCPLCGAADGDQTEIMSYLMTSHKPTNAQVCQAVESACQSGSLNILRMLSPDIHSQQLEKIRNDVVWACRFGSRDVVEYLLQKYCTPCMGETCVCGIGLIEASGSGHIDIVSVFFSHGADMNARDEKGNTCLHWAARWGKTDNVRYIIDQGSQIETTNNYGISPLHMSAYGCQRDVLSALLEKGANVDMKDIWGQTPLHVVMIEKNYSGKREKAVKILLQHGANVSIKDKWGRAAISQAKLKGYTGAMEVFTEHGHGVDTTASPRLPEPDQTEKREILFAYRCLGIDIPYSGDISERLALM